MELVLKKDVPIKRSSWIDYFLGEDADYVVLEIYTVKGYLIRKTRLGSHKKGAYQWFWDGRTDKGEKVANGTYYLTIRAEYSPGRQEATDAFGLPQQRDNFGLILKQRMLVPSDGRLRWTNQSDMQTIIIAIVDRENVVWEEISVTNPFLLNKSASEYDIKEIIWNKWEKVGGRYKVEPDREYFYYIVGDPVVTPQERIEQVLAVKPGDKEPTEKTPSWLWGVLAFGGLLIFTTMKRGD